MGGENLNEALHGELQRVFLSSSLSSDEAKTLALSAAHGELLLKEGPTFGQGFLDWIPYMRPRCRRGEHFRTSQWWWIFFILRSRVLYIFC